MRYPMFGASRLAFHVLGFALAAGWLATGVARGLAPDPVAAFEAYQKVVADTAGMVGDAKAQALAAAHGLRIVNVAWEDTGRFKGSSVGPNISDMSIQVQQLHPRTEKATLACMPVIRYPNFEDITGDVRPYKFHLLTGNQKGQALAATTLSEFLADLRGQLRDPASWRGEERGLLAARDGHVLVSAQACFLPVPMGAKAEFNPVLFNYASYEKNPAVLTLLCTREGTSVTVIDNKRDAFPAGGGTWGQRLFFNKAGQRASLTGQRLSDFQATRPEGVDPVAEDKTPKVAGAGGMSMVLLVQVPLKYKPQPSGGLGGVSKAAGMPMAASGAKRGGSDVEAAVIGHGRVEGPFTEIDGLKIERDPKYPIRVTVQFYKATSNGVVSAADMAEIAAQIKRVYSEADYVGSLVTQGRTDRPTEHDGPQTQPPGWWADFWDRHQQNTGQTREATMRMLSELFGPNWRPATKELAAAAAASLSRK